MTPQARKVLAHLQRYKSITVAEAVMLYGINRLAARIHEIRQQYYFDDACVFYQRDIDHWYRGPQRAPIDSFTQAREGRNFARYVWCR